MLFSTKCNGHLDVSIFKSQRVYSMLKKKYIYICTYLKHCANSYIWRRTTAYRCETNIFPQSYHQVEYFPLQQQRLSIRCHVSLMPFRFDQVQEYRSIFSRKTVLPGERNHRAQTFTSTVALATASGEAYEDTAPAEGTSGRNNTSRKTTGGIDRRGWSTTVPALSHNPRHSRPRRKRGNEWLRRCLAVVVVWGGKERRNVRVWRETRSQWKSINRDE